MKKNRNTSTLVVMRPSLPASAILYIYKFFRLLCCEKMQGQLYNN
ncbi:hypothetical protein [Chryseobacterium polytrichastri]|nr:hypothetical protein [Chryseobacterium polytrichastri]